MNQSALWGTSAVPIIVAIIQALKYAGLPTNLAPLIAIIVGLTAGFGSTWLTTPEPKANSQQLIASVALGLAWGLAASGLYECGRTAIANSQQPTANSQTPTAKGQRP